VRKGDSRFRFGEPTLTTSGGSQYYGPAAVEQIRAIINGKRTLVLVCGYNNSSGAAVDAYGVIAGRIREHYDEIVGVLWPGHTSFGFWFAVPAANKAGRLLRGILAPATPKCLDIETHSLGARLALEAMSTRGGLGVRHLLMTSPAVDDEVIEVGQKYGHAVRSTSATLVCYSARDPVLGTWYRRLGSLTRNPLWGDTALGYGGPQHPDRCWRTVKAIDFTPEIDTHGGWKECERFYARWAELLTQP
jgi:hypothetical protein